MDSRERDRDRERAPLSAFEGAHARAAAAPRGRPDEAPAEAQPALALPPSVSSRPFVNFVAALSRSSKSGPGRRLPPAKQRALAVLQVYIPVCARVECLLLT